MDKVPFGIPDAMKAAQWEVAKGHLRALVVMQGSYHSGGMPTREAARFEALSKAVEAFIESVEDEGLHE